MLKVKYLDSRGELSQFIIVKITYHKLFEFINNFDKQIF
jgi:hypothetical protein